MGQKKHWLIPDMGERVTRRTASVPTESPREMYARLTHGRMTPPEEMPMQAPAGMNTHSARGYSKYARGT